MGKKKKNWNKQQSRPNSHQQPSDSRWSDTSMVYTVRIEPHPDAPNRYAEERRYREQQINLARWLNRISAAGGIIALLALLALVYYACITKRQWQATVTGNGINQTAFDHAYRPYIGVSAVNTAILPKPGPGANNLAFRVETKNFGPVPGTKYSGDWRVFLNGQEMEGRQSKLSDSPFTLFPSQTAALEGSVGRDNFKAVMSGNTKLAIEVTVDYDAPQGHNHECQKFQFEPRVNGFFALGNCDMKGN